MSSITPLYIDEAAQLLSHASRIAVLTGAGVSAESGVATFRDAQTGLWSHFSPQQLASQEGFAADPGMVWRWYMLRLMMVEQAQPNAAHQALGQLEELAANFTLITQNVDDLHERAGSRAVLHLHGSIARFRCNACEKPHTLQEHERVADQPPHCSACGDFVRPAVVWFGEFLSPRLIERAYRAVEHCQVMLVVGTSGMVYPAAHLPVLAKQRGARVIDVNPEVSPISELADIYLQGRAGELLPLVLERLQRDREK